MSDIDEIKSRLNIVELVGKHVHLKKAGRNFKGLCPFHNEKTPSFVVSPDRQIFHCFGCARGGTVFDFFMEFHHVEFVEALEELAALAGVTLTRRAGASPESALKEKLYAVNHLASEFYHYLLTKHRLGEKGLQYLKGRGISDKSIKTFTLGYSPNSWEGLYRFLRKKGYDDELMEKAGLVLRSTKQRSGEASRFYDRFRGRVMFTLKDHRGNVVGFAGRVLDPSTSSGQARQDAKYINTSETPVYVKSNVLYGLDVTRDAIAKENEAVVMEGELDVISSFQAGIPNVVAIKGSALTEGHVRLLKRYTERLAFALDSDMAGDAAARRGIEIADMAGLDMRVVTLPTGKDPDDAARENPGLLKKAIKEAVPVYDYFLASAMKRFDATTAFGKRKITDELFPIIAKIENSIVQNHYIKKLASAIDSSEESIDEGMKKVHRGERRAPSSPSTQTSKEGATSRPEKLEVYLLALTLQGKTVELFEELEESGLLPEFVHPTVHKIIEQLITYLSPQEGQPAGAKVFLIKDFADSLPKELIPTLDEAFLWDMTDLLDNEELFMREWLHALREFRKVVLKRKIQVLTKELAAEGIAQRRQESLNRQLTGLTASLKELEKSS